MKGGGMLRKNYSKTGRLCRVTFDIPPEADIKTASVCGEFNEWNKTAHPMKQRKDGRFSTTISLAAGRPYRFKYLLNGNQWKNDVDADDYVPNEFGTQDSLVRV